MSTAISAVSETNLQTVEGIITDVWWFPTLCLIGAVGLLLVVVWLLSLERRISLGGLLIALLAFGACVSYANSVLTRSPLPPQQVVQCLGAPYDSC